MAETSARLCGNGEDCAILFARTPSPGRVKSRLFTHLTPDQACQLHCASTNDMIALLDRALPTVNKWLFLSEPPAANVAETGLDVPGSFRCAIQEGKNLGDRMAAAFARAFASGSRRVVIFGSDSPTLPVGIPAQAFQTLDHSDLVLGPTSDGGYYLIGCRRFDAELFQDVEWSTSRTLVQTLANVERLSLQVALLEPWFDLDEWKDIERVLSDARRGEPVPCHLAAFLKQLDAAGSQSA